MDCQGYLQKRYLLDSLLEHEDVNGKLATQEDDANISCNLGVELRICMKFNVFASNKLARRVPAEVTDESAGKL